ncbi:MAG TPA: glycosyltransferase [Candidatus Baltobacteraceae bacterium]|nr:glycosyltransferase [Candidatus Baltobacteraceae bacterium]
MLLDIAPPLPRHYSHLGSVLLISLHADPTTSVGAPENGGVTVYVRELARALVAEGWQVDVVTRRQSPDAPARENKYGATIIRVDVGPPHPCANDAIAPYLPEATAAVREIARSRNYRFVSSHYWLSGVVGDAIATEFDIPHVHTLHSHGIERKKRDAVTVARIAAERHLLERAKIVTLSRSHIGTFERRYGVDCTVHVVPGGVDTELFRPGDRDVALTQLELDVSRKWIGYVGRLTKEKGIDDLIHAFALVHMLTPDSGLFVVGGARTRSRIADLARLASDLGIAEAVTFLGPIPNARVAAAFQGADVIAVPSHYEAFGLVALEARATGTPVVASDVGGLKELVTPQSGGQRVRSGDYLAWAQALELALRPDELLRRRRLAVEQRRDEVYSWNRIAQRIAAIALAQAHV